MSQNKRNMIYYVAMLIIFGIMIALTINKGQNDHDLTEAYKNMQNLGHCAEAKTLDGFDMFIDSIKSMIPESLTMLMIQIIVIIAVSRLFGYLFTKIGQPTVIGEIVAGIVLGPSLLGKLSPETFNFLFSPSSLGALDSLSKIGLILFMFIIGLELDLRVLKTKINQTIFISHASIIIPFFLGLLLSYLIYDTYAVNHASFLAFSLFIGISMSITAFPVLARILQERNLMKSHLGTLAIASAANDDITAWCLLAAVIAIAKAGTFVSAIYTLLVSIAFVLVMIMIVRPFMKKLGDTYCRKEVISKPFVAFIFLILFISATITQIIGIHALFGAFLAGVIMSPNLRFRKILIEKIEDISLIILLPLFFVFTGLRTEIGLLNTADSWIMCGTFTLVAIIGKFGGGALSSKMAGENWKDSLSIGALMNTRGLMELVVLNIGYEMGILPPAIFVMLVLMALFTTFMTSPVLNLIDKIFKNKNQANDSFENANLRILLSFGLPESGKRLFNLAGQIFSNKADNVAITALHLTNGSDINPMKSEEFEKQSFIPINEESRKNKIPFKMQYKVTNDVTKMIINTANNDSYDLLLLGAGINMNQNPQSTNSKSTAQKWISNIWDKNIELFNPNFLLFDKSDLFMNETRCDVGIFINRYFTKINSLLVTLTEYDDLFLLNYIDRVMFNQNISVTIIVISNTEDLTKSQTLLSFKNKHGKRVNIIRSLSLNSEMIKSHSLMFISYEGWKHLITDHQNQMKDIPSTLILKKGNKEKI